MCTVWNHCGWHCVRRCVNYNAAKFFFCLLDPFACTRDGRDELHGTLYAHEPLVVTTNDAFCDTLSVTHGLTRVPWSAVGRCGSTVSALVELLEAPAMAERWV